MQQKLDDVAPLLQTAREKGKLLTMMESHGELGAKVQTKLDELSDKREGLQKKLHDRLADAETKREAVATLNNEVMTVAKRLDELAASTEDLTAVTYDTTKVLEQRDNYEVQVKHFFPILVNTGQYWSSSKTTSRYRGYIKFFI